MNTEEPDSEEAQNEDASPSELEGAGAPETGDTSEAGEESEASDGAHDSNATGTDGSVKSEEAATPARDFSRQGEFLKILHKQIQNADQAHLRMTPKGLFVSEEFSEAVSGMFAAYLREAGDSGLSDEKAKRVLFGERPSLRYLIEGKSCLAGFLAEFPNTSPQAFSLPTFIGDALLASGMLHPRDPGLQKIDGLSAEFSSKGLRLQVATRDGSIEIREEHVRQLEALTEGSRRLARSFAKVGDSRRAQLTLLVQKLQSARFPAKGSRFMVPSHSSGDKEYTFLESGSIVFVLRNKAQLVQIYERTGRNFGDLLLAELAAMRGARQGKLPKGIRFAARKDRGLAVFEMESERFIVSLPALRDFCDAAQRKRSLLRKLPARFSLKDALSAFQAELKDSIWVMDADVPREIASLYRGKLSYRKNQGWFFAIESRSRIVGCAELSVAKESPRAKHQGGGRNAPKKGSGRRRKRRKDDRGKHSGDKHSGGKNRRSKDSSPASKTASSDTPAEPSQ